MANKITCTCGHSWNKSDSSKKDMKICHICGKDNTMKNGGWLDSYDDELQLGGYVYPTNYVPQAQKGTSVADNTTVKKPIVQNPIGFANDPDVIKYNKVKNDPNWGEPYKFLTNWYADPETQKRLKSQGAPAKPMTEALNQKRYDTYLDWYFAVKDKNRKDAENIWKDDYSRATKLSDFLNQGLDTKYDNLRDNTTGFHVSSDSLVALNSSIYPDKEKMYKTAVHELTHATPLDDFYVDYFKKNKPKNSSGSEAQYFSENPTEIYPRIQDLRYQMWKDKKIAPGTKITPEMLDGYDNDSSANLRNYYSPEELAKIMNEIAYESNNKKSIRQAENGIEGTMGGLTDQGFNYNGAWGGPSMQNGGLTFLEPTSRKLPMGYAPPNRYPSTELATSIGGVGDEPAYLIPSFKGGKRVNDPDAEFRRTGEHLGGPFKTWQEADEWERTVRHPYVEKGQNIPTPFRRWGKDFAMGGSLPGAVGFTYARTGGIPSNGPYAKKTKASAQNGMEMKFYQEGLDWTPKNISQDGSKTKKKKTLILAENDPELWNDKYNKGKVNPFITEAAGIKKYVNEYFPDEDVEIVPAYKDSFNEALKRSDANTRLVTLAHSGNNLFGVPVSEYLQSVSKTPYQNCYAGTCHGDDIVEGKYGPTGIDIRNLNNFNVRSNNQWQGFAPVNKGGEEGFKDSFFRRTKNPELEKINQEIYSLDNLYNNKGDKDPSISRAEYDKKLNELYKRLQATSYISNQQKATDTKTYKFVPYPARTVNDPLKFNPQNILQQKKQGGEITKDGGWLNKYADGGETPQAQLGTHMLTPDFGQVGENIMEMLSVPQKALTKLFSGKYQTPSEAMNIKNPVGAFAVDAILDPVNLMGAGAVAKASTETGALSKAYKYNPLAFKPNPEAYYRQVGKDAIDDALSTKLIRERGEVVSPESFENFNRQITDLHGQGDYVDYYEKMKAQTLAKEHGPMPYFMKGELFFDDKSVMKGGAKSKGVFQGKKTKADHLIESNYPSTAFQNSYAYKFSPGDLTELGGTGVLKPNPSLRDVENFNLYKQHWLQGYKKVKPPKKKEEGGEITKDDNGYWNPDNWGEPVEIGSNEITMQGVYEPLLGISDTGDTQMMYPGEDYTFDGESVTEYPIAQNGKKVKVSMSDFKKMGNSYKDSVNTYDYNQALWDAVRSQKSSEVDEAISQNKNLIRNTSNIKPTSYDNVTVGGKNYRIPNYQYPQMDPWETYEPVEGWWERAQSSLNSVNNAINKTSIGKQLMKVNDKIDETLKDVWHKFTSDDKTNNVINKGAEVFTNKQPVSKPTPKPVAKKETPDRFGLTREDYIQAHKSKPVLTPGNKKGDAYYEIKKNGEIYKVYTKSGGNNWVDLPEKEFNKLYPIINKTPVKPKSKKVETKKPEPKKEEPIKKVEQPKPIERKQNIYEGSPVYSPGAGTGMGSALVGFANQKGDTTYIKPEDYERFAVPKYGKEFIESKKKKNGGWLEKYK